ncbi:MAG: HAD hydrolase family protein, partial [Faecalibacterium sp.]|nr:HAD hydrolase family protein [Faecalibacterium sp.]
MDKIRLIASDMDATLLDERGCLPAGFEQTVHALAALGIRFAPASGRPLYTLEAMFPTLQN